MLVHKGGQINNVQLIIVVRSAEMSHLQIVVSKYSKSIAGTYIPIALPKKFGS